jgi:hypothetical protein
MRAPAFTSEGMTLRVRIGRCAGARSVWEQGARDWQRKIVAGVQVPHGSSERQLLAIDCELIFKNHYALINMHTCLNGLS